jgi:hypothetical protein
MVTNEDMPLLVVKEQLTHFKVKQVIDDECKDPLAWWRTQEGHFSYVGFVVVKSWELWDRRLKQKFFLALQVYAQIYIVLGWAQRILI